MITLNCLDCLEEPALSRIFLVKIDPSQTVIVLKKKIWEENPEWRNLNPTRLVLYTPKEPISTSSKERFNDALKNLNLGTSGGRDFALDELSPTRRLESYDGLSNPVEEVLHIIVFPLEGRCR
jgi:Crinkler effector protein N-terminal domain